MYLLALLSFALGACAGLRFSIWATVPLGIIGTVVLSGILVGLGRSAEIPWAFVVFLCALEFGYFTASIVSVMVLQRFERTGETGSAGAEKDTGWKMPW